MKISSNNITLFVGTGTGGLQAKPPRNLEDSSAAFLSLIVVLIVAAFIVKWINKKK